MKVKTGFVDAEVLSRPMKVYFSHPIEAHYKGAVILFQEAFGVNGHIQDVCNRLAHEGYYVLAPELFHRFGDHIEIAYSEKEKMMGYLKDMTQENLKQDIAATLKLLNDIPNLDPSLVASIGFCVGGYAAVFSAIHFPLRTAISYYGGGLVKERPGIGLKPLIQDFSKIRCPVLFHHGDKDSSIPLEQVQEVEAELKSQGINVENHIYENSNHGFFCGQRSSYHAEAAHESWERTLEWLKKWMKT